MRIEKYLGSPTDQSSTENKDQKIGNKNFVLKKLRMKNHIILKVIRKTMSGKINSLKDGRSVQNP